MGRHPFAQNQKLLHPQRLADLCTRLPADDDRLDPRQVAFEVLGVLLEEDLADHRAEDGVAEELQPLVGGQAVFGPRGVRQGRQQQALVLEVIADPLLKLLQKGNLLGFGSTQVIHRHCATRHKPG